MYFLKNHGWSLQPQYLAISNIYILHYTYTTLFFIRMGRGGREATGSFSLLVLYGVCMPAPFPRPNKQLQGLPVYATLYAVYAAQWSHP